MHNQFTAQKVLSGTVIHLPSTTMGQRGQHTSHKSTLNSQDISPRSRNKRRNKDQKPRFEAEVLGSAHCSSLAPTFQSPPRRCHKMPSHAHPSAASQPTLLTLQRSATLFTTPVLVDHYTSPSPPRKGPLSACNPPTQTPSNPSPRLPAPSLQAPPPVSSGRGSRLPSPRMQVFARPGSGPVTGLY